MSLVVDASMALRWGLGDEASVYADAVLTAVEREGLHVPELWAREVANGLAIAYRRKRITHADQEAFLVAIHVTKATELDRELSIVFLSDVEVTSISPLVQTTSATAGRVISEQQIRELPLLRHFQQIRTLSPGTVANLSSNTEMGRGDGNINVAGNRSKSNNLVVDGTPINSPGTNSTPNISVPAPDAIQEFIDWMAEIGYVGAKGTKLVNVYTLNQGTSPLTAPYGAAGFSTNKALNGFQLATTDADSIYNSLQASLTKRLSKGLQFLAPYTYSKSIDDASGAPTNEFAAVPGNQQNRKSNRSVSDFDRPNRFGLSGTYSLPKLYGGTPPVATRLANEWQLGGIVTLQSGAPYTVVCVAGSAVYKRAVLLPNPTASASGSAQSLTHYCNTSAFAPTRTNTAPFGNSGRNMLHSPDQRNVDLSAVKFIPVKGSFQMEFRTEFFNTFNRVNFALPNNNVLVPATLGTITSTAAGPRVIQFALKASF